MLSQPANAMPQLCPADLKRASSTASSSKVGCSSSSSTAANTHNRMMSLEHDPSYMSSLKTLHAKIGAESSKPRRRSLRSTTPIAGASPRLGVAHLALPSSPYATSTFYDSEDDDPDTQSGSDDEEHEEEMHDAANSAANSRRSSFIAQPYFAPSIPLASPTFSTAPSTPRSKRPCSRDSTRRRSLLVPEAPRSPTLPRTSFSGAAKRDDWQSSFTGLVDVQRAATATRASIDSTSATAAAAAATHSSSGTATPSASTSRAASPLDERAASHPSGSPIKATFIKTRRTFSAMPTSANASQSRSRRAESAPPPRPEGLASTTTTAGESARTYTPSAQPNLSTIHSVAPLNEQRLYLTGAPLSSKRSAARGAEEQGDEETAAAVQKSYALRTKFQAWSLGIRFSALRARRKWNAATGQQE